MYAMFKKAVGWFSQQETILPTTTSTNEAINTQAQAQAQAEPTLCEGLRKSNRENIEYEINGNYFQSNEALVTLLNILNNLTVKTIFLIDCNQWTEPPLLGNSEHIINRILSALREKPLEHIALDTSCLKNQHINLNFLNTDTLKHISILRHYRNVNYIDLKSLEVYLTDPNCQLESLSIEVGLTAKQIKILEFILDGRTSLKQYSGTAENTICAILNTSQQMLSTQNTINANSTEKSLEERLTENTEALSKLGLQIQALEQSFQSLEIQQYTTQAVTQLSPAAKNDMQVAPSHQDFSQNTCGFNANKLTRV